MTLEQVQEQMSAYKILPETALRLGRYFGNSACFWMNLQTAFELAEAERQIGDRVIAEVAPDAV